MAEDQDNSQRTEDPTQKRLDDALKRGDVVKSQEVNTWFIIAGGTLVLIAFSGGMGSGLTATLRGFLANAHDLRVDGQGLIWLSQKLGGELLATLAIPFLLLALAAIGGNLIQHRLVWTTDILQPKLNRIVRTCPDLTVLPYAVRPSRAPAGVRGTGRGWGGLGDTLGTTCV